MPELKVEDAKPEVKEEAKPEIDLAAKFAQLEKENAELKTTAQRGLEEAAGARSQVQLMLDQIQRAAAQGDPSAKQAAKTLQQKFDEDPVAAMNELVTMRVGPIVQEYLGRAAEAELKSTRAEHGKLFSKYESEVHEFMKDMPLDVKAKPGSYSAALQYVRSQHLEEEVEDARKQEREKLAQPEGASASEPEREKRPRMSREEREIMSKGFKDMDEDDWQRYSTPGGIRPPKAKKKVA